MFTCITQIYINTIIKNMKCTYIIINYHHAITISRGKEKLSSGDVSFMQLQLQESTRPHPLLIVLIIRVRIFFFF